MDFLASKRKLSTELVQKVTPLVTSNGKSVLGKIGERTGMFFEIFVLKEN